MRRPGFRKQFRRDYERAMARGKNMDKIDRAIQALVNQTKLPPEYRDHPLKGPLAGIRELHLESDWLLLYRVDKDEIIFIRTGTHDELF